MDYDLICLLPFHLWHVTGCTVPLVEFISDMVDSGVSLRQIETILADNRLERFYAIKDKFLTLHRSGSREQTIFEFESESL